MGKIMILGTNYWMGIIIDEMSLFGWLHLLDPFSKLANGFT
jgi:hypothetical protein